MEEWQLVEALVHGQTVDELLVMVPDVLAPPAGGNAGLRVSGIDQSCSGSASVFNKRKIPAKGILDYNIH